ncbi:MAG: hypothetical protein HY319_29010 [Armatimonadetes bacterium]|nr:hypothetical protein [Armatimonadota bacterium]
MRVTSARPIKAPVKEWTVLVYNAGQADEGLMCTSNLRDLERVGSDENTHVICKNYRTAWWPEWAGLWHDHLGERTYYVTQNAPSPGLSRLVPAEAEGLVQLAITSPQAIRSPEIASRRERVAMGEAATLKEFLLENVRKYPARHYAVIVSGHGAGFAGQAMMRHPDGRIQNEELGKVLEEVRRELGRPVDLVNLNTCYGAGIEAFYPLRKGARAAVSSQGVVVAHNQPLGAVLSELQSDLKAGKHPDGLELASTFVRHARIQDLSNLATETLSAVDLEGMAPLAESVGRFHRLLMDREVPPEKLSDWMERAERLEYSGVPRLVYVQDLGSFAQLVSRECEDESVRQAAAEVLERVEASVVAEQHAHSSKDGWVGLVVGGVFGKKPYEHQGLTGLSIHYDSDVNARGNRLFQIKDTEFGKLAHIEEFLKYASQPADRERAESSWLSRRLEQLKYEKRIFEYKMEKRIPVPFLVPALKRAAHIGAMAAAGAALGQVGVPAHVFWGGYIAYLGLDKAARTLQALPTAEDAPAVSKLKTVDAVSDGTIAACLGGFGLSLAGVLPPEVRLPAVALAVTARAGRYLAAAWVNAADHEAFLKGP